MKLNLKHKPRLPTGRPGGIPQPDGPERIERNLAVIYDSVLKRARAGEPESARLALEIIGKLPDGGKGAAAKERRKALMKELEKVAAQAA